ncbi:MAG: metallophosphoesterase [Bacillota bacterium]|jgi:putative phosphoesterase|nr:metallophosphoesterase [Bacillota bacterium]HHU30169.1 metallophosphoesterase family protein [Bacillota bacterium]
MRIGVLSDTHIPTRARCLPPEIFTVFKNVELILHAGDLVDPLVLSELETLAPVQAVAGNMDPPGLQKLLGRKKILELAGFRIGLVHGDLGYNRTKTPERALQTFAGDNVDAVVFGHTHQPCLQKKDNILLFNPGSPTDRRHEPRHSCGLLILGKTIEAEFVYL